MYDLFCSAALFHVLVSNILVNQIRFYIHVHKISTIKAVKGEQRDVTKLCTFYSPFFENIHEITHA